MSSSKRSSEDQNNDDDESRKKRVSTSDQKQPTMKKLVKRLSKGSTSNQRNSVSKVITEEMVNQNLLNMISECNIKF